MTTELLEVHLVLDMTCMLVASPDQASLALTLLCPSTNRSELKGPTYWSGSADRRGGREPAPAVRRAEGAVIL